MSYVLELTITGLCVLTMQGADPRAPEEANILLVKADTAHGSGANAHVAHFPLLTFGTARANRPAAGSSLPFKLVPAPDGSQLGMAELRGAFTLTTDEEETRQASGLSATWRPDDTPERERPQNAAEETWLNWVPSLARVNPSIKPAISNAPYAGLKAANAIATLSFDQGQLAARGVYRRRNGNIAVFEYKTPAGVSIHKQALAGAMVLRIEGLTEPVWFTGPAGELGLDGDDGEVVRVSVTNLPAVDPGPNDQLVHFARYYDLTEFSSARPPTLNLPELDDSGDTSSSVECPVGRHTLVP